MGHESIGSAGMLGTSVAMHEAAAAAGGGGGGSVNSVTAGDSSVTIGGTPSDPTVAVDTTVVSTKANADLKLPKAGGTMTGAILFSLDNTIDVGATGATRPRTVYVGTSVLPGFGAAATPAFAFDTDTDTGLYRVGANRLGFATAGTACWEMSATGHLIAATDNTFDIGADGATRPRNIRASGVILGGDGSAGNPTHGFDSDEDNGIFLIGTNSPGMSVAGALHTTWATTGLTVQNDTDAVAIFGRTRFDARTTDRAYFSHVDCTGSGDYALVQLNTGATFLNSKAGTANKLTVNNVTRVELDGTGIGFFATAPVAKQTSGANLTNNVTSGGTDDTIANFTDLTIYANDSAAIRNDIYQLARKLKQVNDALRSYGLLT